MVVIKREDGDIKHWELKEGLRHCFIGDTENQFDEIWRSSSRCGTK